MEVPNWSRTQLERLGINDNYPFLASEGRSVGHISPPLAVKLGLLPERTIGNLYPLPELSKRCQSGDTPQPVSPEEFTEYIKAKIEFFSWYEGPGSDPQTIKAWNEIDPDLRRETLRSDRMLTERYNSRFLEQACQILEADLQAS